MNSKLKFKLNFSDFFKSQFKKTTGKKREQILMKLREVLESPVRFKSLSGYRHLFEVKVDFENKFSRLIYAMYIPKKNEIRIFGIFDRGRDFKDFFKKFKNEVKKIKK
jgi:hypothetical protein